MEQQIIIKTESEQAGDEEVLLFYVNADGTQQQGILATPNALQGEEDLNQENMYVIDENFMAVDEEYNPETHGPIDQNWTDEEIQQILMFYNDNKETFLSGATTAYNLWSIACKTMITTKSAHSCLVKLEQLKREYIQVCLNQMKDIENWPYFEICHQTFHDDGSVIDMLTNEQQRLIDENGGEYPVQVGVEQDQVQIQTEHAPVPEQMLLFEKHQSNEKPLEVQIKQIVSKKVEIQVPMSSKPKSNMDDKVKKMLELLLKFRSYYKNDYFSKALWKGIARELGDTDSEYWHRRFMNYKQHYIRTLEKGGPKDQITWPYMQYFDKLFENDKEFERKYVKKTILPKETTTTTIDIPPPGAPVDWDTTEVMVLSKYCFDCFDEFQDPTIPDKFLWGEIGRLLDRTPESCKEKITELKRLHLEKYLEGDYNLKDRLPLAIVLDNLICREVKKELQLKNNDSDSWTTEEIDLLVQFMFDNIGLIKDPICYFVCFEALATKLKKFTLSCKLQWADLVLIYKSILNDKEDDTDIQVDWRYIELFDNIFNYGMDQELLEGFDKTIQESKNLSNMIAAKKLGSKSDSKLNGVGEVKEESKWSTAEKKIDLKDKKLLEFFIKNKTKFGTHPRLKVMAWKPLANSWGWSSAQCMQRFKDLKNVYLTHLQKEIKNPGTQIHWPYYDLSKKAYGYRALKSKLKNSKVEDGFNDDWTPKHIIKLIKHLSQNFVALNDNGDRSKWHALTRDIGRTEISCHDKFLELRKSYRKLSTMKARNPDVNVSWLYYNMMDAVYNSKPLTIDEYEEIPVDDDIKNTLQEDDDFQCIIVIPEGEEQATDQSDEAPKKPSKWTNRSKKKLLIVYLNYLRSHKGQEIDPHDMWTDIAAKFINKTPKVCKKMFIKMKTDFKILESQEKQNSPYYSLMQKIFKAKPKFIKLVQTITENKTYKDCALDDEKVQRALQYYLEHVEEFNSPQYEKKYLWNECANFAKTSMNRVYNKISYMKEQFSIVNNEIDGKETPYSDILKEIIVKETAVKATIENESNSMDVSETEEDQTWSDDETEALLSVYLANLDKFKNPKFNKSFLWKEVSNILRKSALSCSKKMQDCRAQYRSMVKDNTSDWKFYDLCQKIYGTGRKDSVTMSD